MGPETLPSKTIKYCFARGKNLRIFFENSWFESLTKKLPEGSFFNMGPEGFEPTTKGL